MPQDTNLHKAASKGKIKVIASSFIQSLLLSKSSKQIDFDIFFDWNDVLICLSVVAETDFSLQNLQQLIVWYFLFVLCCFLFSGDVGGVEECLANGEEIDLKGAQNRTALHRAVGKGHNPVVQLLISKGADIHVTDQGGLTPL